MSRRNIIILLAISLLMVFAVACTDSAQTTGDTTAQETGAAKPDVIASQWAVSPHSGIVNADSPNSPALRDTCVTCHDGQGFANKFTTIDELGGADPSPIGCNSCHLENGVYNTDGWGHLPGDFTVQAGLGALCMDCHNIRSVPDENNERRAYPHYGTQSAVLTANGAFETQGVVYGSSPHLANPDSCISCHMAKDENGYANHYFNMKVEYVDSACGDCHAGLDTFNRPALGDYDGNGKVEGIQDEVKGLMELVEKEIIARLDNGAGSFDHGGGAFAFLDGKGEPMEVSNLIYKATWNYDLIKSDGSFGVHNPIYAVQVLQETYKMLTGQEVPNARLR